MAKDGHCISMRWSQRNAINWAQSECVPIYSWQNERTIAPASEHIEWPGKYQENIQHINPSYWQSNRNVCASFSFSLALRVCVCVCSRFWYDFICTFFVSLSLAFMTCKVANYITERINTNSFRCTSFGRTTTVTNKELASEYRHTYTHTHRKARSEIKRKQWIHSSEHYAMHCDMVAIR